jgi:hypothetical protein
MTKLIGSIRIGPNPGGGGMGPHFEVLFVPFHGKVNAQTVRISSLDELVAFLIEIKISEDDASRWAGRARAGIVLIPNVERTEELLKENGLLA